MDGIRTPLVYNSGRSRYQLLVATVADQVLLSQGDTVQARFDGIEGRIEAAHEQAREAANDAAAVRTIAAEAKAESAENRATLKTMDGQINQSWIKIADLSSKCEASLTAAEAAKTDAASALTASGTATADAATALAVSQTASRDATSAVTSAASATTSAESALATANQAATTASTAAANAVQAATKAQEAITTAEAASQAASTASTAATAAAGQSATASSQAATALADSATAVEKASSAITTAQAAEANAANALEVVNIALENANNVQANFQLTLDKATEARELATSATTTAAEARTVGDSALAKAETALALAVPMQAASDTENGQAGLVPTPQAGTGKYLRNDGSWAVPPDTTYHEATQTTAGLMSAQDKKYQDGIVAYVPDASVGITANSLLYPETMIYANQVEGLESKGETWLFVKNMFHAGNGAANTRMQLAYGLDTHNLYIRSHRGGWRAWNRLFSEWTDITYKADSYTLGAESNPEVSRSIGLLDKNNKQISRVFLGATAAGMSFMHLIVGIIRNGTYEWSTISLNKKKDGSSVLDTNFAMPTSWRTQATASITGAGAGSAGEMYAISGFSDYFMPAGIREDARAAINNAAREQIFAGLEYELDGEMYIIPYNLYDQQNLTDSYLLALAGEAVTIYPRDCYGSDTSLELTSLQMQELYRHAVKNHKQAILAEANARKAQVELAQTEAEILALMAEWGLEQEYWQLTEERASRDNIAQSLAEMETQQGRTVRTAGEYPDMPGPGAASAASGENTSAGSGQTVTCPPDNSGFGAGEF